MDLYPHTQKGALNHVSNQYSLEKLDGTKDWLPTNLSDDTELPDGKTCGYFPVTVSLFPIKPQHLTDGP